MRNSDDDPCLQTARRLVNDCVVDGFYSGAYLSHPGSWMCLAGILLPGVDRLGKAYTTPISAYVVGLQDRDTMALNISDTRPF